MKRILIFLLSVVLALVFVGIGCKPPQIITETVVETVTETVIETVESEKLEEIELIWSTNAQPESTRVLWQDEIKRRYEEANPHITIIKMQAADVLKSVQAFFAAGDGPSWIDYRTGPSGFAVADQVLDLSQWVSASEMEENFLLYESFYNNYDPTDILLGLPRLGLDYFHLLYNKTMFKDAGITWEPTEANGFRMTWEEFTDSCDKLKAAGYVPFGIGGKGGSTGQWWITNMLLQNYEDKDDWKKLFTNETKWGDPIVVDTLVKYKEMYDAGYFPEGYLTLARGESLTYVSKGIAAIGWDVSITSFGNATFESLGDDLGHMLYPVITPGNPYSNAAAGGAASTSMIPVWSKHPEETFKFLMYKTSKEANDLYYTIKEAIPLRKDALAEIVPRNAYEKQMIDWSNTVEIGPYVNMVATAEILEEINVLTGEMLIGNLTPQEVGDAIQKRADILDYPWLVK